MAAIAQPQSESHHQWINILMKCDFINFVVSEPKSVSGKKYFIFHSHKNILSFNFLIFFLSVTLFCSLINSDKSKRNANILGNPYVYFCRCGIRSSQRHPWWSHQNILGFYRRKNYHQGCNKKGLQISIFMFTLGFYIKYI